MDAAENWKREFRGLVECMVITVKREDLKEFMQMIISIIQTEKTEKSVTCMKIAIC